MSQAESESAETDTDADSGWDIYPQVTQHPHTIIAGTVTAVKTRVGTTSVGVVLEDPSLVKGTIWQNREVPDGFDSAAEFNAALRTATTEVENYANGVEVTEDAQDEARQRIEEAVDEEIDFSDDEAYPENRLTVDYKVADPEDREYSVQEVEGTTLGISVGSDTFGSEQVEEFEQDAIMVWYRGITGQFIGQALDFNGRPSARWKDDGYLVKGLLQHPLGWFNRDEEEYPDLVSETDRSTLASKGDNGLGRPPRFVRPGVIREDVEGEEIFIDIDRYQGGRMLSGTVGFNEGDWDLDDYLEAQEEAENSDDSVFEILDGLDGPQPAYHEEPEGVLVDALDIEEDDDIEYVYDLTEADGWQPKPDNAFWGVGDGGGDGGGSFDTGTVADDEVEHPTDDEVEFAEMISEQIAGTGADPDDPIFEVDGEDVDLEGIVGLNADQFSVTPDVDAIREVVYENTSHLDADDL